MALGLGLAIGPVIGSFAYSLMNYVNTFYFFTAYVGIIGMTCVSLIPARINQSSKKDEGPNPFNDEVGYLQILSNRRALGSILICVFGMGCSLVADPVLSVRLINMGMTEVNTGFAFGVLGGSQALGAPIAGWLGGKIPIKYVQLIGSCIMILALYMMGPSLFFNGLPDKIWIIFVGLFLMGFSVAFVFALVALEIIDSKGGEIRDRWATKFEEEGLDERQVKRKVKKQWKVASPILADRAAALNEMSFAFGSLIGPIVGGKLTDVSGYRHMTDYCCIAAIIAMFANFCFVILPDFFIKKRKDIDIKDEDEAE